MARRRGRARQVGLLCALALAFGVTACGQGQLEYSYPESRTTEERGVRYSGDKPESTIFGPGDDLISSVFGSGKKSGGGGGGGIGVNTYLWRASLDTIAFMPLASADPFGGVIITDWYSPPETPNERFKLNIYILDHRLRADGLRVAVFRQDRAGSSWRDVSVRADTAVNMENQILTRARQLRVASTNSQ